MKPTKNNISPALSNPKTTPSKPTPKADESRTEQIRLAAYALAEKRNFTPGHDVEDWVQAEASVNSKSTRKT